MFKITFRNYHGQRNRPYLQIWPAELALSIYKHYFIHTTKFDNCIKTQRNNASDDSVDVNYIASYGLDQITNHNVNMDVKYNDDSQLYDPPPKQLPFFIFWWYNHHQNHNTIAHTPPTWKIVSIFQVKGKSDHAAQCDKSISLIKFTKEIFEIDSFEQHRVIIKRLLQYKQLK